MTSFISVTETGVNIAFVSKYFRRGLTHIWCSTEYLEQQGGVRGIDSINYNAHVNCHEEKHRSVQGCDSYTGL